MGVHDESPAATLRQLVLGFRASALIYVAAELGIADLLRDGPRSSAELATLAGAHPDALHRILRGLAQVGVFAQLDDGRFGLTPAGEGLCSDSPGSLRAMARFVGHETQQRGWGNMLHTARTGETAFDQSFGQGLFAYLGDHPEFVPIFNAGMLGSTPQVTNAIVAAYDFGRFATIADIAGAAGSLLTAILQAYPGPRGILFDLPHLHDEAEAAIRAVGFGERCRFDAGDFFKAVSTGADAYVLKLIIHDWDDERSLVILRNCRSAIAPGGRLLVIERLLPEGNEPALEPVMMDVTMLAITSGRERSEAEYAALFEQAGFRLTCVIPTASPMSIIEAIQY